MPAQTPVWRVFSFYLLYFAAQNLTQTGQLRRSDTREIILKLFLYILKRFARSLISLFLIILIVFTLMRMLPTETYFGDRAEKMSDTAKQQILIKYGLDKPIPVQFAIYMKQLAHFDLGDSITYHAGIPVTEIIEPKIGYSLKFGMASLILALALGIPMGIGMVNHKGKWQDSLGNGYILFINAVPSAVYYLFLQFGGTKLMNISMLYKQGDLRTCILPVVSMALGSIASYAMWTRRYMLDQVNQDYVALCKAKGLTYKQIMRKHVLRNAFAPLAQNLPTSIIFTISGSLYIESLYSIPGMGSLLVNSIQTQDNNLVQAVVMFYALLSVTGMLLGDLAMMAVDPRISFLKKGGGR